MVEMAPGSLVRAASNLAFRVSVKKHFDPNPLYRECISTPPDIAIVVDLRRGIRRPATKVSMCC